MLIVWNHYRYTENNAFKHLFTSVIKQKIYHNFNNNDDKDDDDNNNSISNFINNNKNNNDDDNYDNGDDDDDVMLINTVEPAPLEIKGFIFF